MLEPGDAVVLYTDGVTEAWNSPNCDEMYEDTRLAGAVAAAPQKADEILAYLEADLEAFTNGAPRQDDVTLLVLTADK